MAAAAALAIEEGLSGLTHRAIAQRAHVPLGSTTYYFPTLELLTIEALTLVSSSHAAELEKWRRTLATRPDAETIVSLMEAYLANRSVATLEYEVYSAAARRPELRELAWSWADMLERALRDVMDANCARGICLLLDGAIVRALMTGASLDNHGLRHDVAALLASYAPA